MTSYGLSHFNQMVRVWKTKSLLFWLRDDPLIVFWRQNHVTFIFVEMMSHDLLVQVAYSSSLNKENHDCDSVWISDLNKHRFLWFYFSVFSLALASVEKIYQTVKTVFDHISKHLAVHQKYSAVRHIFNSLLGVCKCGHTVFCVWCITW